MAAVQWGRYLGEHPRVPDADDAADDPCTVTRAHVEAFQGWMIETRSASTALNKRSHGLQGVYRRLRHSFTVRGPAARPVRTSRGQA
ncbi:hypothetical protein GCM10027605_29350 [Micromonospora zhanjiangensis]